MDFVTTYAKELISILVPLITWFLNIWSKKSKLIWTSPHSFLYLIREVIKDAEGNDIEITKKVSTASIRVINRGQVTLNQIELAFNWEPQHINMWPIRHFVPNKTKDGRFFMTFGNLAPKEEIGLEILSVGQELPALLQVRSAECIAENVPLVWYQPMPKWKINVIRLMILIGCSSTIYLVILILQFLVLKTPFN